MNKRIRKKKTKQQLIRAISGLVEAAEEMQREQERRTRQAGISYIKYIEAVRERQYGIMPVYTPLFEKEGARATWYAPLLLARIAAGSRALTTEYRRAAETNAARGLMTAAVIES